MIDPLARWQPLGDKPDYAGLLTYGGTPYVQDVVEVIPKAVGSADVTAVVAERIVREVLTGLALRRRSAQPG